MSTIDSAKAREFAKEVVAKLRTRGFEALWAGGCVRDQLLGADPKDYDVATNARPDQIREVFGRRKTLAIGAAFGVITVLGPRSAGQVEVATFRRDATYSDGRHPDSVAFSNAEEDARRRDFTVNGLFFDPLAAVIIDYVGGQEDLSRRVIRAIGDAEERLAEDKLRMLRAVRFATTLDFRIDSATMSAVQCHADELGAVSAERVAAELRRLLLHLNRRRGVELLHESKLLGRVLPELRPGGDDWAETLAILQLLNAPTFAVAVAALLRTVRTGSGASDCAEQICRRWKLSNTEVAGVLFCLNHETTIRSAQTVAWPVLQRVLVDSRIDELLSYCEAVAAVVDNSTDAIMFCRETLARPQVDWNPTPLITGNELRGLGIAPGPVFRELLEATRDSQLNGEITSREAAISFVQSLWQARKVE